MSEASKRSSTPAESWREAARRERIEVDLLRGMADDHERRALQYDKLARAWEREQTASTLDSEQNTVGGGQVGCG